MSLLFSVWYGVIFIRMGSYQDGIFKFVMKIPENFPDGDCPVSYVLNLNNNITGQVCSNRFLLCIDCLENESTSSCHNPYQIQICISYMQNDQYIFYYILSVFIHIEKSLQMDKILWRNFCQSLRKPSRQKFKNLFACEFTAQECRDESEISNNRFNNEILGGSLDLAWLYYTDLVIQWYHVTLGLCQCYFNNLLLYSFALI